MGDRIVYTIKQSDGLSLNLYSHWGGYDRYSALAYALEKSRPRWNDESYASRIIISNLIGPEWDSETGWGLWAGEDFGAGDYPSITVHLDIKQVEDETGWHSFDEFISFHGMKVDTSKDVVV